MKLTSSEFNHGRPIPLRYTADGSELSPPLTWSGVPEATHSFALVCEDMDSPIDSSGHHRVHWLVYGISPTISYLPEGLPPLPEIDAPIGALQGKNSFGQIGYRGPSGDEAKVHRYVFTLLALDADLGLRAGATYSELRAAMRGHILEQAGIKGTFRKESTFRATFGDVFRSIKEKVRPAKDLPGFNPH